MNHDIPFRYPVALTVAGSDSSGGAGIQADLKTFSALGVYGASVITAVTAQNTQGVRGIQAIDPDIVRGQLEAVFDDLAVDAVKTGMLHNTKAVEMLAESLDRYRSVPVIVDPVMVSTSGSKLIEDDTIDTVRRLLFPRAALITPNISEAELLSGIAIRTEHDLAEASGRLLDLGCRAVLIKGGHLAGRYKTDLLVMPGQIPVRLEQATVETNNTHGTGCTLSSAIAAYLVLGYGLEQAVKRAKSYLTRALQASADVLTGAGHGPVDHFFAPSPLHKIRR